MVSINIKWGYKNWKLGRSTLEQNSGKFGKFY